MDKRSSPEARERMKTIRQDHYKHGGKGTRLYRIWQRMKWRCYNKNMADYRWYGKKGIEVCPAWKSSFIPFRDWATINGYQEDLTIDRIESDGDYEPNNCQWIPRMENLKKSHEVRKQNKLRRG